jgi:hypothetical protein
MALPVIGRQNSNLGMFKRWGLTDGGLPNGWRLKQGLFVPAASAKSFE